MKKLKFATLNVKTDRGKVEEVKILETPTLLKRLFLQKEIDVLEYTEKITDYTNAIKEKEKALEDYENSSDNEELKLRNYQEKIVNYASEFKSFALFNDMRTGKTPTLIKILEKKKLLDEKIIIMCPGKVTGNWIKEFKKWVNKEAFEYNGEDLNDIKENILVMSYTRVRLSLKDLEKWKPIVAVLDEAHVLRNSRGSRAKLTEKQKELKEEKNLLPINQSILRLGKIVEHRYPLSGTPGVNDAKDLFAILQFQMPKIFKSFWRFAYYYFDVQTEWTGGKKIKGYKDKDKELEIQELLNYCSSNIKRQEAMPWLIEAEVVYENLELTEYQKELEHDLLENAKLLDKYILNPLEQTTHYTSIVLNPEIIDPYGLEIGSKNEYVLKFIKDNPELNIGVFSTRKEAINLLEGYIKESFHEKEVLKLTGTSSKNKSIEIQDKINKKSKKRDIIFLGTIGTSKEGISLMGLNVAIIMDQSWVPSHMEQLKARLDATTEEMQEFFGKKKFIILHVKNTIDEVIKDALALKKTKTQIINDYKKFIKNKRRT